MGGFLWDSVGVSPASGLHKSMEMHKKYNIYICIYPMGVTNLLLVVQNNYFSVKQFSKSCSCVWNNSKHVFHIMFVMIQQDYFQKNVFIVPNIYKWGHCRQPNEVTRGQPQNLNGVSQLTLGLFFGNSEDVRPKMCLSHQHMLYGYIYICIW